MQLGSEEKLQLYCVVLQVHVQDFDIPHVLQSIISTHVLESLKAVTAEVCGLWVGHDNYV